jgi:hypothetical protein
MHLPNTEHAVVDIRKLREYCLNPTHPRGKHKARVFESALGLTQDDAEQLRSALLTAIREENTERLFEDEHGTRYRVDFEMSIASSRAEICSIWIVRSNETFPRLVTCYVC